MKAFSRRAIFYVVAVACGPTWIFASAYLSLAIGEMNQAGASHVGQVSQDVPAIQPRR